MKIEDVPQYPETLTFVPLEESSNRIFAFIAVFPNGRRLTVKATYPSVGRVDIAHAKEFATRLVEKLLIERDEPGIHKTN